MTVEKFFEWADRFKFWNEMEKQFRDNPPSGMYQTILDKCRVEAVEKGIIIKVSPFPGGLWFCVKVETVDGEATKTFVLLENTQTPYAPSRTPSADFSL